MGRNFGLLAIVGMLVGSIAIGQQRSSEGLRVLYDFADAKGDVVKDRAGDLDLKVSKTSGVKRSAGALEIHGPTLIRSVKPAQKMTEVAKATQAMTIEAWIKPSNTSQEGPARIVTLSYDSTNRNFTLGQEKDVFDVRFRTSKTSKNGMPSVMTKAVKTELTHVVYTFDKSGKALLFVNGKQRSDENVGADLNSWDGKYHLALGDEMVGSRLWKGTYFLVAIFDRALAAKEIEQHFKAGIDVEIPAPTITKIEPKPEPKPETVKHSRKAELPISNPNYSRTGKGLQVLYDFSEPTGVLICDRSGAAEPLDLKIETPREVERGPRTLTITGKAKIQSQKPATRLTNALQKSNAVTIETWVRPENLKQEGPARIVTLSPNTGSRSFTIAQEKTAFEVRFRTSKTDSNGANRALVTPKKVAETKLTHIVYTREKSGLSRLYVNGRERAKEKIEGGLEPWDPTLKLSLGNEMTGDRPWKGSLHLVAIFNRALSIGEIGQNFRAGPGALGVGPALITKSENELLFENKIAPLISNHCLECHDSANREGKLDLTKKALAFAGGKRDGHGVVAGKAEESAIWKSVVEDEMPEDRDPLSDEEKAALKQWIEGGASWTISQIDPAVYVHGGGEKANKIWVQRLTVPEYGATVKAATGVDISKEARELLPPELRADGFSNTAYNLNVDLKHVGAYARLAELIVERMDAEKFVKQYSNSKSLADDDAMELFVQDMGTWLLRGPLSQDELYAFRGVLSTVASAQGEFDEAARFLIEAMLQSPRFIYRIETQQGDGTAWPVTDYELASRLSYLIWGASPDEKLMRAAENGELSDTAKMGVEISRMLADPRAIERSQQFASEWLNLGRLANLAPNPKHFPDWNPELATDMKAETLAFFRTVVWDEKRPLSDLLSAQVTHASPRLAKFYGLPSKEGEGMAKYDLSENSGRGGLLTQASILTVGGDEASMVSRGLFVMHDLLRGVVKDPPPCVDVTPISSEPGLTQRGIAENRIENASCGGCHQKFEPLAFGLEKFDGIGAFHEKDEHENKLRDDGQILFPGESESIDYKNSAELMALLAGSKRVKETITWKLTQFAMGRPMTAQDATTVEKINAEAQKNGGTYSATIKAIAASDLVRMTPTER